MDHETQNDRIATQGAEFDAMDALAKQWRRLQMTAIVDDDYPEVRHHYESALVTFLDKMKANGRFAPGSRHVGVLDVALTAVSIVQEWAARLGLRHQGVLVSAIRGCDSAERSDSSKFLVRIYRGVLLRPHCADIRKAASFMVPFDDTFYEVADQFLKSIDHYPNHWILHFLHACEITGYKHPTPEVRNGFSYLYSRIVKKFHLTPESEAELDQRLNADEDTFRRAQK